MEFVDSTRSDMFRQLETRSSAMPMDDRKVEALSEIEIFYAIRGYAADLEEQCIQNSQCNDASSAVASLEHLVSLHKNTVAGWYVILLILILLTDGCTMNGLRDNFGAPFLQECRACSQN